MEQMHSTSLFDALCFHAYQQVRICLCSPANITFFKTKDRSFAFQLKREVTKKTLVIVSDNLYYKVDGIFVLLKGLYMILARVSQHTIKRPIITTN